MLKSPHGTATTALVIFCALQYIEMCAPSSVNRIFVEYPKHVLDERFTFAHSEPTMIRIVACQTEIALNLGNMIRTAACLGVPISVVEPLGFPFSIKALRRSAMDYADIAEIDHHADWSNFCAARGERRVLLTTKAEQSFTKFRFEHGDALILGRESGGVDPLVARACAHHVKIPMIGGGRSLNVSTAAAIVASEALRQLGAI